VGELDVDGCGQLREALEDAIDVVSPRVLVDLRDATFVDTVGLVTLVGGARSAQEAGGALATICPDLALRRVFDLAHASTFVRLRPTRAEALNAIVAH
jgi:anti-sigma B factor antagonist